MLEQFTALNKKNTRLRNDFKKLKLLAWAVVAFLCVTALFLINRHNVHTYAYNDQTGQVSLFPIDEQSRNYRVSVAWDIKAVPRGIYGEKRSYIVHYVTWPNGGTTEFPDCILTPLENKNTCTDINFRVWRIEVQADALD